jgi:hypothetical protein
MNKQWLELEIQRTLELAKGRLCNPKKEVEEFKTDQVEMETYAAEREALYVHDATQLGEGASRWVVNLRASVFAPLSPIFLFFSYFWCSTVVGLILGHSLRT